MDISLGIISPCSTCKNQRDSVDPVTGAPPCPRRVWATQYKKAQAANNEDTNPTQGLQILSFTGNERSGDTSSTSLKNPVYSDSSKSILVWVARLEDNQPIVQEGTTINTDITSDSFDTNYMNCRIYPYVPVGNENEYFQKGALKEKEGIVLLEANQQQLFADTMNLAPIGGVMMRANLFFDVPRIPTQDHNSPEGT